jgi:hypothetical protein
MEHLDSLPERQASLVEEEVRVEEVFVTWEVLEVHKNAFLVTFV